MSLETIYGVVSDVAAFSVLIPLLLCLIRIKAFYNALWAIPCYLLLCFIAERSGHFFVENDKISNAIYNTFTLLEYTILVMVFSYHYQDKKAKIIIRMLYFVVMLIALWHFVIMGRFKEMDNIVNTSEAFVLLGISGFYFQKILLDETIKEPKKYYFFWMNLAFSLYFGIAIILFFSSEFIETSSRPIGYALWSIHLLMNFVTNGLMSIGIWKLKPIQR